MGNEHKGLLENYLSNAVKLSAVGLVAASSFALTEDKSVSADEVYFDEKGNVIEEFELKYDKDGNIIGSSETVYYDSEGNKVDLGELEVEKDEPKPSTPPTEDTEETEVVEPTVEIDTK